MSPRGHVEGMFTSGEVVSLPSIKHTSEMGPLAERKDLLWLLEMEISTPYHHPYCFALVDLIVGLQEVAKPLTSAGRKQNMEKERCWVALLPTGTHP